MKDPRYNILVKILDGIRAEAPHTPKFSRYRSKKPDDVAFSRGKAFIHLFLLARFGLEVFSDRNNYICDETLDGGLDAYFISETDKTVYLIQSKFKNTDTGFAGESISISDLVRMELDRILHGESKDSNGITYNPNILEFQLLLDKVTRKQVFQHKVIFLANLNHLNDFQIRKLTNNLDYEVFNFERSYLELVKPLCSGTYYDPDNIVMELDISEKASPQLSQRILTTYGICDITAVFVPTSEIGRVMLKYKNAILRYNPRNYLGLSKNPVNKDIRNSIITVTNNDFALLNNGITILADEQEFTVYTGTKNVGRLTLTNPQIINGGQTAYTLSEIYSKELEKDPQVFNGKEVLVKVVVLKEQTENSPIDKYGFINTISSSTNRQTLIKAADNYSANPSLNSVQDEIFRRYGYLIELKQGEFYSGRQKGYLNKEYVLDRIIIIRSFMAFSGHPSLARGQSQNKLFESTFFQDMFQKSTVPALSNTTSHIFYAYMVHEFLAKLERKEGRKSLKYGYALRYGKYAVVYASSICMHNDFKQKLHSLSLSNIEEYINKNIPIILNKWKSFEDSIQKLESNKTYFNAAEQLADFDSYYKGTTLQVDIQNYFS